MSKRKAVKRKGSISKHLNREVGILGFIALIIIGVLICGCVSVWASTANFTTVITTVGITNF